MKEGSTGIFKRFLHSTVVVKVRGFVLIGRLEHAERSGHSGGVGNILLSDAIDVSRNIRLGICLLRGDAVEVVGIRNSQREVRA